jgi:hypothetical protein
MASACGFERPDMSSPMIAQDLPQDRRKGAGIVQVCHVVARGARRTRRRGVQRVPLRRDGSSTSGSRDRLRRRAVPCSPAAGAGRVGAREGRAVIAAPSSSARRPRRHGRARVLDAAPPRSAGAGRAAGVSSGLSVGRPGVAGGVTEPLLTARMFAALLGVSTGALLRWTRAGLVPGAVKLPSGAIRYRPELIEPWLDELAMGAADRGVLPTRANRARAEGYAAVRPLSRVTTGWCYPPPRYPPGRRRRPSKPRRTTMPADSRGSVYPTRSG